VIKEIKKFPIVELARIEKQFLADMRPSDKKWLIDRINELETQLDRKVWDLCECMDKVIELHTTIVRILVNKKG